MSYDVLREIADSYGLIAMGVLFLTFTGWTFRRGSHVHNARAAHSIFEDEDRNDG